MHRTLVLMIGLSLAAIGFAPMAAAHWDDTANGGAVPAHHVTTSLGGVDTFNFRPLLCFPNDALITAFSHSGYNVDEANWHAAVADSTLLAAYDPATVPPDGAEGVDAPSINDANDPDGDVVYVGPDLHTTETGANHGHHDSALGAGDSDPANNDQLVDTFTPQTDDHLAITAGGGLVLVAVDVVNADNPQASTTGVGPTGDVGVLFPTPDGNPTNGVEDCPSNTNGIPAGNDAPTGAGITFGFDTSVEPTLPTGQGLPSQLTDGPCLDVGDADSETAFGGAFFLYDEDVPTPPAATGFNIGGCQMPPGFASQAGDTGAVRMRDAAAPPNGAPYTVCFDHNADGTCVTNSQATPDSWDQCTGNANLNADQRAVSDPLGDKSTANPSGFANVGTPLGFFGESTDGTNCWPKKAASTNLDDVTAGGPGQPTQPAPAAQDYNPPNGVTFADLVVFTSVCLEDEDGTAPEIDPANADPDDSNECGTGNDNAALNSETWFVVHPN